MIIAGYGQHLFVGFALLNVAGYDAENGWLYHPVRQAVRLSLLGKRAYWREALAKADLLDPLLRCGGGPVMDLYPVLADLDTMAGTGPSLTTSWQRGSAELAGDIGAVVRRFMDEERALSLWPRCERAYHLAGRALCEVANILGKTLACIDDSSLHLPERVVLVPNLLDAAGRGYSLSSADTTWLFFGPRSTQVPEQEVLVHEFLHRFADAMADETIPEGTGDALVPRAIARFPLVAAGYPDFRVWVSETVVRAATVAVLASVGVLAGDQVKPRLDVEQQRGFLGVHAAMAQLTDPIDAPSIHDAIEAAGRHAIAELQDPPDRG